MSHPPPSIVDQTLLSIADAPSAASTTSTPPTNPNPTPNTKTKTHPLFSPPVKAALLTLHFFFPHHLLPALDLLDRGLLTCLTLKPECSPTTHSTQAGLEVWYVQSASAVTEHPYTGTGGRYRDVRRQGNMRATQTAYEVRLDSWGCSCAGFAADTLRHLRGKVEAEERESARVEAEEEESGKGWAARRADQREGETVRIQGRGGDLDTATESTARACWQFGGLLTKNGPAGAPICKHILAAVMVKAAPDVFAPSVTRRAVSKEEMAGWGARWGDQG